MSTWKRIGNTVEVLAVGVVYVSIVALLLYPVLDWAGCRAA